MTTEIVDNQAESGIIATLMIHPEFIMQSENLKAGYFYNQDNGCIYWAIGELYKQGIDNIDAFNITNMLKSNSAVKKTLDKYNLPSMQKFIDLSANVARNTIEEYKMLVDQVIELAFKRELCRLLSELQNQCYKQDVSLGELNDKVYGSISNLTEKFITNNSVELFGDKADDLWQEITDRRTEDGVFGIPSKFPLINKYFTYEPTELVLLKARMKMGKSAFMMNEAIHKIKTGVPTVYFDTEMSDRLFFERMLANLSGVDIRQIKSGKYTEQEEAEIKKQIIWIKEQPFVHIYNPQFTNDEIYAICNILKYKMDLQFVVFDYLKSNTIDSSAQYNELGGKCDFLKNNIAGNLNLSVLAGCQLNRNNQVADSDKLERYASVSMMWRNKSTDEIIQEGEECGNFRLNINLNRLGEQMNEEEHIDFVFDGAHMRINQALTQHSAEREPF